MTDPVLNAIAAKVRGFLLEIPLDERARAMRTTVEIMYRNDMFPAIRARIDPEEVDDFVTNLILENTTLKTALALTPNLPWRGAETLEELATGLSWPRGD